LEENYPSGGSLGIWSEVITTGLYEWYYTISLNQEPKEPAGYSQEDDDFQPDPRNCSELWYMDGLR
jgi:hypothetical protein